MTNIMLSIYIIYKEITTYIYREILRGERRAMVKGTTGRVMILAY